MADQGLLHLRVVRDGERAGIAFTYNEQEIDRRLGVLERAGADPDALAELRAWHEERRKFKAEGG